MSESGRNIFFHHIDDMKDDICNTIKKIQQGTHFRSKKFTFYRQFQKTKSEN